ncbi:hypothetical protein [Streptomyces sp. BE303]|uniref:hypothetical protein n=1 Tax=Streptomyces sp. BE303 TaxID=3002528 RepID=UPI002E79F9A2|nr:hypothetical protein [Streptomyces sp. BE303]MED7947493.1 hypothetical protein [Streptomyces sp. BE303]
MDSTSVRRPVPRSGWVFLVLAMLCTAPAVVWLVNGVWASLIGPPLVLGTLAVGIPLFARESEDFRGACLAVGWCLVVLSVLGSVFGLFVLTPPGIVLLAAASRSRPEPRHLPLAIGALVSAATLGFAGWAIVETWIAPHFQEPDALVATVQDRSLLLDGGFPELLTYDGSRLGHGATHVDLSSPGDGPGGRLVVVFDPRTPDADLTVLRQLLADLPGVSNVTLCAPPAGNCR